MSTNGGQQARNLRGRGDPATRLRRAGEPIFNLMKPRAVRIGLAGVLIVSALVAITLAVNPARAHRHLALASLYGSSNASVQNAVWDAGWPQQENNWCGVATIAAVADFRGQSVTQQHVADYLNTTTMPQVSEWGTPGYSPYYWGPAFKADISGDDGTDPRSLAAGLSGLAGTSYHQLIEFGTNYDATLDLIYDLERTQEPISVIVFHGLHSVLVSGVVATDNPVTDPGSIVGLEVWDPGYGILDGNIQGAQEVLVPLSTWLTNPYYWATPYSANYYGSIAEDPDPSVGPYSYNPSQTGNRALWIGHYVYFRQDASTDPAFGVSPDWAFSRSGALIEGYHGEEPNGYTGPAMSVPATLPDTSIDGPAFWSQSAYQVPGAPASVLAWAGTDRGHHLNIETSPDGFTYQNKEVLNLTSIARPSVIVVPTAGGGNAAVIAWTGTDRGHHLHVLYNVYGLQTQLDLAERSPYAPSLAYFGGQIWIAWAGTDGAHTLNVLALGPQGVTPGAKTTLWSNGSHAAPDLVPDLTDNLLLLSWQVSTTTNLDFLQSSDGVNWAAGIPAPFGAQSPYSPAMMVINPAPPASVPGFYMSWVGWNSSLVYLAPSSTRTSWEYPNQNLALATFAPPALGYDGQYNQILVAWTGVDNHMNVVMMPG